MLCGVWHASGPSEMVYEDLACSSEMLCGVWHASVPSEMLSEDLACSWERLSEDLACKKLLSRPTPPPHTRQRHPPSASSQMQRGLRHPCHLGGRQRQRALCSCPSAACEVCLGVFKGSTCVHVWMRVLCCCVPPRRLPEAKGTLQLPISCMCRLCGCV